MSSISTLLRTRVQVEQLSRTHLLLSGGVERARTVKDCTLVIGECQVATLLVDAF
jgi:hypothetical protein